MLINNAKQIKMFPNALNDIALFILIFIKIVYDIFKRTLKLSLVESLSQGKEKFPQKTFWRGVVPALLEQAEGLVVFHFAWGRSRAAIRRLTLGF